MKQLLHIALLVTLTLFLNGSPSDLIAEEKAKVGQSAPDFTLTDVSGNTISLSDFRGNYIVLEWINYDCPFVAKHYNSKNMQSLQDLSLIHI